MQIYDKYVTKNIFELQECLLRFLAEEASNTWLRRVLLNELISDCRWLVVEAFLIDLLWTDSFTFLVELLKGLGSKISSLVKPLFLLFLSKLSFKETSLEDFRLGLSTFSSAFLLLPRTFMTKESNSNFKLNCFILTLRPFKYPGDADDEVEDFDLTLDWLDSLLFLLSQLLLVVILVLSLHLSHSLVVSLWAFLCWDLNLLDVLFTVFFLGTGLLELDGDDDADEDDDVEGWGSGWWWTTWRGCGCCSGSSTCRGSTRSSRTTTSGWWCGWLGCCCAGCWGGLLLLEVSCAT